MVLLARDLRGTATAFVLVVGKPVLGLFQLLLQRGDDTTLPAAIVGQQVNLPREIVNIVLVPIKRADRAHSLGPFPSKFSHLRLALPNQLVVLPRFRGRQSGF